jgi:hypothetical protein
MQKEFLLLLLLLAFSLVLFVKRPIKCREGENERKKETTKQQGNTFALFLERKRTRKRERGRERKRERDRERERERREREREKERKRESYAYEPGIFLTAKHENYFQT